MHNLEHYERILRGKKNVTELYMPIEHPAFGGWEVTQPCVERWLLISDNVDLVAGGTALDLGCHTGWFCRQFHRAGWRAIGIDRSKEWLSVGDELMRPFSGENNPTYVHGNLEYMDIPECDVALCLSVLMYLFPAHGWNLLSRLSNSARMVFLDWGGQYAHRVPFTEEDIEHKVALHTSFSKCGFLGRSAIDRPMYLLER